MNRKGQIDTGILGLPVIISVIAIMGIFILLTLGMKVTKGSSDNIMIETGDFNDKSILFRSVEVGIGETVELAGDEAYSFKGEKFIERDYIIVPAEQKSGLIGSRIFGVKDVISRRISFAESLLLIAEQERDFSYYRYVVDNSILNYLNENRDFSRKSNFCIFLRIQDNDKDGLNGYRALFFEKSDRTNGRFESQITKNGEDTESTKLSNVKGYFDNSDKVSFFVQGKIREIYYYDGECLK